MKYVHRTSLLTFTSLLLTSGLWAQQPFAPSVLAASGGKSTILWGSYHNALVRSTDLGVTWLPIYITQAGLPQPPVLQFDIDSGDPSIVYLGTTLASGGIWKSVDGGVTWTPGNAGLPTSGGSIEYFKQIPGNPPYFYLKIGQTLYKSTDRITTWRMQALLPGSSPNFNVNEQFSSFMYYIDEPTLKVYSSNTEGLTWKTLGTVPANLTPAKVLGVGSLYTNVADLYYSVDGTGAGQAAYFSPDYGATNNDTTSSGLGLFTKFHSATTGPAYAYGLDGGSYRSVDNGMTWKNVGIVGLEKYNITAIDMTDHTILYGVRTDTTRALIRSTDSGDTWSTIPATIKPTIAKPAAAFNVVLEEGAPYSVAFTVQSSEDTSWKFPVTLSTTGETWLSVGSVSGSTPLSNSFTISSIGLAPGTYTSTLRIDAPQAANKFVTVPIQLTIRPLGSIGPGYQLNTVAGNGNATDTRTSGPAASLGIGATRALTFDNNGNLLISAGSRIWSMTGQNLTLLAGNGVTGSSGDGLEPTQASIGDPEALAVDPVGTIYFPEYSSATVRKLSGANISTPLQLSLPRFGTLFPNGVVGSHSLVLDSVNRFVLTGPAGLLRYDLAQLLYLTQYTFVDPYSMVVGPDGNYYISDRGANQIFRMTPAFRVTVFAGTGAQGFAGDGGAAVQANFNSPSGMVFDPQGTLYVADTGNQRVRAISTDGIVRTIAGSGVVGFAGDNQSADFASFRNPVALAIDGSSNLYVADSGNSRVRRLTLRVVPTPKPSAIHKASSASSTLSPGSLFELFGDSLSSAVQTVTLVPWARSIAGVSVTINGVPAPLYYVSPTQINGQIPYETAIGTATAVITVNGSSPAQIGFTVVAASPSVLVYNGNHAVAVNQDGRVNASTVPALPSDIEVLYLTGIGQSSPAVATGVGAPSVSPFAMVNYSASITLNGQPCTTFFLGLAPGFPALAQANFQIPNLPPGDYPLVVTVNGVASDPVMLTVGSK